MILSQFFCFAFFFYSSISVPVHLKILVLKLDTNECFKIKFLCLDELNYSTFNTKLVNKVIQKALPIGIKVV